MRPQVTGAPGSEGEGDGSVAHKLVEWRRRQKAGVEHEAACGVNETAARMPDSSGESGAKVFVYDLPEGLNSECEELMSQWNWMLDMGLEEWPPPMLGDLANFAFALEPVVHAVLLQSPHRTLDPSAADWFYIPFYSGCSYRQSRYVEHVATGWSHHDERLRVLQTWLATADVPSQFFGRRPHAITVGGSFQEFESVGAALFERSIIFTLDVHACAGKGPLGAFSTGGSVPRSCFRSTCAATETVAAAVTAEGDTAQAGETGWCGRASAPADVAVSVVALRRHGHRHCMRRGPFSSITPCFLFPLLFLYLS